MALSKEIARGLLPLVNDPVYSALTDYVDYRIELIRKTLEQISDTTTIYRLQGQITELRRLLDLRTEAIADAKG